jgi:hypothetical protein
MELAESLGPGEVEKWNRSCDPSFDWKLCKDDENILGVKKVNKSLQSPKTEIRPQNQYNRVTQTDNHKKTNTCSSFAQCKRQKKKDCSPINKRCTKISFKINLISFDCFFL